MSEIRGFVPDSPEDDPDDEFTRAYNEEEPELCQVREQIIPSLLELNVVGGSDAIATVVQRTIAKVLSDEDGNQQLNPERIAQAKDILERANAGGHLIDGLKEGLNFYGYRVYARRDKREVPNGLVLSFSQNAETNKKAIQPEWANFGAKLKEDTL